MCDGCLADVRDKFIGLIRGSSVLRACLVVNLMQNSTIVEFYVATKSMILTQYYFKVHFMVKMISSREAELSLTKKFKRIDSV